MLDHTNVSYEIRYKVRRDLVLVNYHIARVHLIAFRGVSLDARVVNTVGGLTRSFGAIHI